MYCVACGMGFVVEGRVLCASPVGQCLCMYPVLRAAMHVSFLGGRCVCGLCYVWPTQCVACTLHGVVCDPLRYEACAAYGLRCVGPVVCVACVCVVLHAVRNVVPCDKTSAKNSPTHQTRILEPGKMGEMGKMGGNEGEWGETLGEMGENRES